MLLKIFQHTVPYNVTEITEEHLPVHSKSNIKIKYQHLFTFHVHYMQNING